MLSLVTLQREGLGRGDWPVAEGELSALTLAGAGGMEEGKLCWSTLFPLRALLVLGCVFCCRRSRRKEGGRESARLGEGNAGGCEGRMQLHIQKRDGERSSLR